jgi:hypothetical protein
MYLKDKTSRVGDPEHLAGRVFAGTTALLLPSGRGIVASAASVQNAMKKLFWLVFWVTTPVWAQSRLVFAWQANPENARTWPACSRRLVKMCRVGYTLIDVTTTSAEVLISSAIAEDALTYTLSPLPSAGLHIYNLTIDARASSGALVHSTPVTVKVEVPLPRSHARPADSGRNQNGTSVASIPAAAPVIAGGVLEAP